VRGARPVDPVDNDGCVTRLPLIAGTVSYFIWTYRIRISLRPAVPARSSLRGSDERSRRFPFRL
jgi:hypothetical protein